MLVGERMTRHPIAIRPDMPVADALKRMRQENVRRFPVTDLGTGKLVGIVTEKELLYASPSPATSLSVHELHYLLSKLTVDQIMTTDLVTVAEDTLIEEAALTMIDRSTTLSPSRDSTTTTLAMIGVRTPCEMRKRKDPSNAIG